MDFGNHRSFYVEIFAWSEEFASAWAHLASKADITFSGPFLGAFIRGLYHNNLRSEGAQWPLIQNFFPYRRF